MLGACGYPIMDNYVEALTREQGNPNGALLEILTSGYEEWDYIIAVEGSADISFYFDFVRSVVNEKEKFRFIECSNKHGVLAFKDAVDTYQWVNPPIFKFLCDKDFDDYLGKIRDGIWYTDRYSIESYLIDRSFINYNIEKFSRGRLSKSSIEDILNSYDATMRRLVGVVRTYCAYMCEIRANGEHPKFDSIDIVSLVDLDHADLRPRRGRIARVNAKFRLKMNVPYRALLARAREFDVSEVTRWLRGKLALQIARKSYELACRNSKPKIRDALPAGNFLGAHGLTSAATYLRQLPGLSGYLSSSSGADGSVGARAPRPAPLAPGGSVSSRLR